MRIIYYNPVVTLGNRLYRIRYFLLFIPILVQLANCSHLYYPFQSHFFDELFEISGLLISSTGLMIRFWASGSQRRGVIRRRKSVAYFYIRETGVFSVIRAPYFLGDFMIFSGLSITLFDPTLILLVICFFLLLRLPVIFAQETVLLDVYQERYRRYCEKVRLIIPSLKHWKQNRTRFRWRVAFQKEVLTICLVGVAFFAIEQIRELAVQGKMDLNPLWVSLILPGFILAMLYIIFNPSMENLPDISNWADYD